MLGCSVKAGGGSEGGGLGARGAGGARGQGEDRLPGEDVRTLARQGVHNGPQSFGRALVHRGSVMSLTSSRRRESYFWIIPGPLLCVLMFDGSSLPQHFIVDIINLSSETRQWREKEVTSKPELFTHPGRCILSVSVSVCLSALPEHLYRHRVRIFLHPAFRVISAMVRHVTVSPCLFLKAGAWAHALRSPLPALGVAGTHCPRFFRRDVHF